MSESLGGPDPLPRSHGQQRRLSIAYLLWAFSERLNAQKFTLDLSHVRTSDRATCVGSVHWHLLYTTVPK